MPGRCVCGKHASFNYSGENPLYCFVCKSDGMVNVHSKRCVKCNDKQPNFNYSDQKQGLYCSKCKLDKMVDVKHLKCISCNLTRATKKYDNFCSFCFINIHPNDPRSIKLKGKSKELKVITHITNKYEDFIYNKPFYVDLEGGCCSTKRRIDLRKLINNTMLCIEIDENQHKSYIKKDDNIRYDNLFMDFTGKYIFIRYNPDKFIDKYNTSKNPFFNTRMETLENFIDKHIPRIENEENIELLEIHHLFYDEN